MDLDALIQRCREGDELAWEALVREYQSRVYGIAYHYAGNREDARDLAQDIFVRVYRKLRLCPEAGAFVPWLIRIARNVCIDHLRRRKVRSPAVDVPVEEAPHLAAGGDNPEQQWLRNARKRMIYKALDSLTSLNKEIILLKDIQGLSLEEIASLLRVPLGTVKSRCNRARIELAQKVLALGR